MFLPHTDLSFLHTIRNHDKVNYLRVQRRGTLQRELHCTRVLKWLLNLCDVSEGFVLTLASVLSEEIHISSDVVPRWMRELILAKCSQTNAKLRDNGTISLLWSLMCTEGHTTLNLRDNLHKVYISLFGLPSFKDRFAVAYGCIYPIVAEDVCTGVRGNFELVLFLGFVSSVCHGFVAGWHRPFVG